MHGVRSWKPGLIPGKGAMSARMMTFLVLDGSDYRYTCTGSDHIHLEYRIRSIVLTVPCSFKLAAKEVLDWHRDKSMASVTN